ncbi:arrestin domain-containing protein 1-like [Phthorimaea operculella]|nr:arrestin domain-containing protein 1-like [Phthorimaea operculella]
MPELSDSGKSSGTGFAARITFDEPRDIYYSGQVLEGCVEFQLTTPLTYSAININFLGEAKVFWSESESEEYNGVSRYVTVGYKGNETYFNTTICASGGMGPITLPLGDHKVPFQFQIPHTAPSSFRGKRGSVSYKVTAYIEYPLRERETLEHSFEVVAPLDLNTLQEVKLPINLEFEETYSCCLSSSPMHLRIHIPASGFCPGQAIPISISAVNESNVEIQKITTELLQKICYHSTEPKSDYIIPARVMETLKTRPILANTKREITYQLVVPPFIAPNLQNCKLIDVGYFVKVTVQLSGCNDDLEDENEICLGLVPLSTLVDNFEHPLKSDLPQAPIPDPNFIFVPPVQNMPYQGMQNSAAYNTALPYPSSGGPLPNVTPYPPNGSPYLSNETLHAPNAAPYPSNSSPFPSHATPYPPDQANHPHPQPGIPMASFRTGNIGFVAPSTDHGKQPPHPGANPPYPGANPPYPGVNSHTQGTNPPYPTSDSPYSHPQPGANPAANPPYPGENPPYPVANPPYPGANPPYPATNSPYPGANPPYPSGGAPYPSDQPAKSFQPPYPVDNAPSAPPS